MKFIIHFGMPKTGSTAIQLALAENRDNLVSAGILYPKIPSPFINHQKHMIYLSMFRQGDTDQWVKHPEIKEKIKLTYGEVKNFEEFWLNDLDNQIKNTKPHTIIISDEGFFNCMANKKSNIHVNIRQFLTKLDVKPIDFKIVGYLRSPPDYYLSRAQQTLKTKSEIIPLSAANFIPAIKRIGSQYKSELKIFPFNRKIFPHGDVVRHFTNYACGFEIGTLGQINESVSGPAMSILQEYHKYFSVENNDRRKPKQVQFLIKSLQEAGSRLGYGRPVLKLNIKLKIFNQMISDLEWLNLNYGISFDSSSYDSCQNLIINDDTVKLQKLTDIIDFTHEEKDRLLFEIINQMAIKSERKSKN